MDIARLFVSQRKLRRPGQVLALVRGIQDGDPIPPIRLHEAEDGTVQVDDGHHRAVAYWLAGRTKLERHEYVLVQADRARPRFGRVADLVARVMSRGEVEPSHLSGGELALDRGPYGAGVVVSVAAPYYSCTNSTTESNQAAG